MNLSRASVYALYGLHYLARQPVGRYVPISEICRSVRVPPKHLAKIFQVLVRARLLASVRGVNGGFLLTRPATAVSVLEVIRAIEGPVDGEQGCMLTRNPCPDESQCAVHRLWSSARREMLSILRRTSVSELSRTCSTGKYRERRGGRPVRR